VQKLQSQGAGTASKLSTTRCSTSFVGGYRKRLSNHSNTKLKLLLLAAAQLNCLDEFVVLSILFHPGGFKVLNVTV
jgi:hypothetical protein